MFVNEAIVDVGIGMAKFQCEYYAGFMPKVGCPGCNGYTMERVFRLEMRQLIDSKRQHRKA